MSSDGLLGIDVFTVEEIASVSMIGIGIPVALTVAGRIKTNVLACVVCAAFLLALAWIAGSIGEEGDEAASFAEVCARLMALTALGETAALISKSCVADVPAVTEMRMYECMALILCGFLVLGQLVDVINTVVPGGVDNGTFLGIVVAGLSYSMRDMLSCLISGLFESAQPHFHPGDTITIGAVEAIVVGKGLMCTKAKITGGATMVVPNTKLMKEMYTIRTHASKDHKPTELCVDSKGEVRVRKA